MDWDVFDFGRKKAVVDERKTLLQQAEQDLERTKKRVSIEVEKACRKVDRAKSMLEVAAEAVDLRKEAMRLANDQKDAGLIVEAERLGAEAALAGAQADLLRADFGYRLARAELQRTIGERPSQF
jgi:outer membrane protein TolC